MDPDRASGEPVRRAAAAPQTGRWPRVAGVLRQVLDQEPAARAATLDAACGDDAGLRAEVESLLAHEQPAADFMAAPVFAAAVAEELQPGTRIGQYRLDRPLGTGGMGTVWLAQRADQEYEKRVAIKLIGSGPDRGDLLRRFRTERQVLAQLEHPHIARLFDGGVTEQGLPYLVMEYVEGTPIGDYCDAQQLSIAARLQLFRRVCGAVQYAHHNLVVHRDLKPGNILVTAAGEPKLLDFGIAKVLGPGAGDAGARTAALPWLTPRYASPEQIRGAPITTASDVYSLGVILYELLTGREPYALVTRSPAAYERAICEGAPARPSTVVTRTNPVTAGDSGTSPSLPDALSSSRRCSKEQLRRRLRGDLDAILLRALRKEPELRYASVEQLGEDLERHLRGLPVGARRGTFSYRATRFLRRHLVGTLVAAALLVSLLGGFAAATSQARIADDQRNLAVAAETRAHRSADDARRQANRAEQVTRFLQRVLAAANPRREQRGLSAEAALDRAAVHVHEELGQDPESEAAVHEAIGQTWLELGRLDEAEQQLRLALAILGRLELGDSTAMAGCLGDLGMLQYARHDYAAAQTSTGQALAMRRRLVDGADAGTARELNNLAVIARAQQQLGRSRELIEAAIAMRRELHGEEHVEVAESLNNLCALLRASGDLVAAEPLARRVLDLRQRLLGDAHPDTIQSRDNLAVILASRGDFEAAEPLMRAVVAQSRASLGPDHLELAVALANLGHVLLARGRHAEAADLLREALAVRSRVLPASDERVVHTTRQLGRCLVAQRDFAGAEQLLRSALTAVEGDAAAKPELRRGLLRDLLDLYEATGNAAAATSTRELLLASEPATHR